MKTLAALALIPIALATSVSAQTTATRVTKVARTATTPEDLYGPLYRAVELARVFPDSKTFADMIPRDPPSAILTAYRAENPQGRTALVAFVARHFRTASETAQRKLVMRDHIKALWPVLAKPPMAVPTGSSLIPLPQAYVVAGGRYQEMYYWDSYFTMLGLKADGETALIESMLANFVSLVERYGHVPNGTRTYYLSRSQPPFLALMMDLSTVRDPATDARRLAALKAEHAYWMAGTTCIDATGACQHVVRMPDGSLLNRYWDARDTPRDESYAEDVATTAAAGRPVNRDLRAGAESGWDYSSRWLRDGRTLATIHTLDIVPVDLNSLLWTLETAIARRCTAAGDTACAADYASRAAARKVAIAKYLWSAAERRFVDWDRSTRRPTPSVSAAMLYPLFSGLATPDQATATANLVKTRLLGTGGLRTTTVRTGQQWDEPNGWAPLVWIAVGGLDRYGKTALADRVARRWIATVSGFYACTGRMVEKYDVESGKAGGGGEYPVQDGFGWTNGVTRALLDRPAVADAEATTCANPARATTKPK
ncbi:alpha,alpha-trehalase TreF [Sphingomonas prati]|uniref:Alpha,alpha-trehalase n=1 Tax=Sphingomonas prati TaxID=1843237 RepID=A0A7W9BR84_9SPHN|nr:alpha,alpha-trehalase TreF [Sphingomonas prati]MBB5728676.1 alpha,alpha-trehalase [Sphingomonas prati]GGE71958.1 periplasmic trehalase [Sphingomonas prati]